LERSVKFAGHPKKRKSKDDAFPYEKLADSGSGLRKAALSEIGERASACEQCFLRRYGKLRVEGTDVGTVFE